MKGATGVIRALVISAALIGAAAVPALAGIEEELSQSTDREAVVKKLVSRLNSSDPCEMQEAAFVLGEARAKEAVIPLMRMLHDGEESCRIVAALALSRIGDGRGAFAVKQAARFDESQKVRTLAAWYYEQYVQPGTYKFVAGDNAAGPAYGNR
jgi:HEAT repeat protein